MINKNFIIGGLAASLLIPNVVMASERTDELFSKISSDGKTAVFKMNKPTNDIESDFNINGYVNKLINADDYYGKEKM